MDCLNGHPTKYWTGSSLFNFADIVGTGALDVSLFNPAKHNDHHHCLFASPGNIILPNALRTEKFTSVLYIYNTFILLCVYLRNSLFQSDSVIGRRAMVTILVSLNHHSNQLTFDTKFIWYNPFLVVTDKRETE